MNYRTIYILVILSFITSCSFSGGENDAKRLIANGMTPKELYQKAEDLLSAGSIDQAIDQYEEILASYPGSKYAVQARLDISYNLYKRKKYTRAINELNTFIQRYPSNIHTPYAYYLRGIVAEEKSSSILDEIITDVAQRDVEGIREAYSYYVMLIEKFPDSKYSKDAFEKLNKLKNILAKHEFYIAIYYTNKGSNIAAINRAQFIIQNFPNSSLMPDALHLMAHNYDILNAIELANDARKILTSNYPSYSPNYSLKN